MFTTKNTHPHRVDVCVGRLAFGHLYSCDAQRPDVCHTVVADLLDHLRSHPEWCADNRVAFCHGVLADKEKWHKVKIVKT